MVEWVSTPFRPLIGILLVQVSPKFRDGRVELTDRLPDYTVLLDHPTVHCPSPIRSNHHRDVLGQLLLVSIHADQLERVFRQHGGKVQRHQDHGGQWLHRRSILSRLFATFFLWRQRFRTGVGYFAF
jgi:hypothetical protein